ncbi:hypothetical protein H8S90_20170 [Olivibacter sp. SDN3]|uniref:hypothetical protein n=1 Tax=Olivibacter sp. SDN3 TaxID=2764720 RepID=UPI001651532D|nr:hypothetical protein [Olivibacter sp. SDN3]QNL49041.1 hypothetical protein H8S90_20170 [Olivibacter sp. SDN3]
MQHHSLMKARLCFERSIPNRGNKELQKAYRLAQENQNYPMIYQAARMELTLLADIGFPNITEQQLIDLQMKAKHTLQSLRQLHEHYSLYELLSHRLTKGSLTFSGKQNEKINDLILSELSITTRGSQQQFETQKLHMLFQSFFFIHTGEYQSALTVFKELNTLFDTNRKIWDFPPYDYLSALDGILDSLRSIGYYKEMAQFIDQTRALSNKMYPDHFKGLAQLIAQVYSLNMSIGMVNLNKAQQLLRIFRSEKPRIEVAEGHEKQLEYLYFEALTYFLMNQLHKASKHINQLLTIGKQAPQLGMYRAGRLLSTLIYYEQDDMEYLEYEVRSYKRLFSKFGKAFKIEKMVFNTISSDPKRRGNAWKKAIWKNIKPKLNEIKKDKGELQLLKYFDCCEWIKSKYITINSSDIDVAK